MLERTAPLDLIPKLHDMLAAFLFRGDDIYKPLSVLSGGEKSRLALLCLLLKPLNLLILDEPTNHLDLHSKDVLLDALKRFGGTVIFVSHDKGFMQDLATRVLELQASPDYRKPSRIRNFPGTYDYYLYRLEQEEKEMHSGIGEVPNGVKTSKERYCGKKIPVLSYEEQKRFRAEKRKLEKEEERLLTAIETCEKEITENETLLSKPEIYSDGVKSKCIQQKIAELKKHTEKLSEEWAAVSAEIETLKAEP